MTSPTTGVVHAKSKEEFDAALSSARQIIVEGDEKLLAYAATQTMLEVPKGRNLKSTAYQRRMKTIFLTCGLVVVVLVLGLSSVYLRPVDLSELGFMPVPKPQPTPSPTPPLQPTPNLLGHTPDSTPGPRTEPFPAPGFATEFAIPALTPVPVPMPDPNPASTPTPGPVPAQTPSSQSSVLQELQSVAWPAVTMAAILALFFVARQAIGSGRNVEVSWKVTEKVGGRMVITKVDGRGTRKRSAA